MKTSRFSQAGPFLAIGLVVALTVTGCSSTDGGSTTADDGTTVVKVGQAAYQDYAAINVGMEEGIFEKHGITLEIQNTDFDGAQSLLLGSQVDIAASNDAQVVLQNAQGKDTTLAFPYFFFAGAGVMYDPERHADWTPFDDIFDESQNNYKEALTEVLNEAKGATVGVTAGGAEYTTFLGMLATAGLSADDFTIINLAAEDMPPALINGSIDLMVSGIPQRLAVQKQGYATLVDQTAVPDTVAHAGFSARREWVDQNPEIAADLQAALLETMAYIQDNPDTSFPIISDTLKQSGTELDAKSIEGLWNVMEVFLTSKEEFETDVFATDGRFFWEKRFQSVIDENTKSGQISAFDTPLEDLYYGKKIIEGLD